MRDRTNGALIIPVSSLRRILAGAVIAVVAIALLSFFSQQRDRFESLFARGMSAQIDRTSYQAVFLTGGQVYFGKASIKDDLLLLSDVYYLGNQTQQNPTGQLLKRGNELHAPREPMVIPQSQVLFIENVREDSQVVQAVQRYLSGETPAPASPAATLAPVSPSPSPPSSPTPRPSPTR